MTNTTIFVMCAGDARRFDGTLKQLLPIGNDTILGRTLRQTQDHPAFVVTHQEAIRDYALSQRDDATVLVPFKRDTLCHSMMSTQYRWTERNVFLLGDAIYSNEVAQRIMNNRDRIAFFGDLWEMFGLSFHKGASESVYDALHCGSQTPYGKLRHAYRSFIDARWDRSESIDLLKRECFFHYIDCWITRDCDTQYEYDRIQIELVQKGVLNRE